jgi:hypothetical protein
MWISFKLDKRTYYLPDQDCNHLQPEWNDISSNVAFEFVLCRSTTFRKASIWDMYNDFEVKIIFFSYEVSLKCSEKSN